MKSKLGDKDVRIYDRTIEILEGGSICAHRELPFIMELVEAGGYWEFRVDSGFVTVYDSSNNKYKGTIEEIREQLREQLKYSYKIKGGMVTFKVPGKTDQEQLEEYVQNELKDFLKEQGVTYLKNTAIKYTLE